MQKTETVLRLIEHACSNVLGLSLPLLTFLMSYRDLTAIGINITDEWVFRSATRTVSGLCVEFGNMTDKRRLLIDWADGGYSAKIKEGK